MTARKPWIVVVGGFLGAGKTTLILAAARLLEKRGLRCAVILNDQGGELVDTRHAVEQGIAAREVTGGCFCCRFSDLAAAIDDLRATRPNQASPDVIFAEPVGSCTDIAATVLAPLLEDFDSCRLAPFTVLVDPARAAALAAGDADLSFLFDKQLQEADLLCLTKADLFPGVLPAADLPPTARVLRLSAKTGEGVAAWLDEILGGVLPAGATTLDIDYARYAEAEAALAWLNLSFVYQPSAPVSPALAIGPWMDALDRALTAQAIDLVHLKVFDRCAAGWLKAALCANGGGPTVEGMLDASPAARHEVLVNLRAKGSPEAVRAIVEEQLRQLSGETLDLRMNCFSPAPPKPERRIPGF
ncbi:MAG TPA: GTP-binding protein [Acidobacteriaceae bacterium]|jgi:Ni2+-binding GTPase involved in maturation of urease and hydrogenase|nr:GTP-binding protein [Acidobacteriaceae bacterium]